MQDNLLDFTWKTTTTEQVGDEIELQLTWANPTYVSQQLHRDILLVRVIDPLTLIDSRDFLGITNMTIAQHPIPLQLIPGSATETLTAATDVGGGFLKTFVAGNMLVQVLFMFSMSLLWGLVNSLMIIAYFPLLNIRIPSNVLQIDSIFYQIATFDLIPMDWILEMLKLGTT